MNREIVSLFSYTEKEVFVDCTVGLGGHAYHILEAFPGSRVIALDVDPDSLRQAMGNLKRFGKRVEFMATDFRNFLSVYGGRIDDVSGLLVDPGISMAQLRDPRRGFSHREEGPLDMRKDTDQELSAFEVINEFEQPRLAEIFTRCGEVPRAKDLAKRIIEKRLYGPITTTVQLRDIVEDFYRVRLKKGQVHPAARVFQALRIYVNRELEGLMEFIQSVGEALQSGARMVVLSYHSLEDRPVKKTMRRLAEHNLLRILKPFPMLPRQDEIRDNPPSRSARLRAAEIP